MTLILLALVGTAALCSAAFLFGFNKSSTITDDASAKRFVCNYEPDAIVQNVVVSDDRMSALVTCKGGRIFLVTMLGDRPVVRGLNAADITPVTAGKIMINVGDLGFPERSFETKSVALTPLFQVFNPRPRA